MINCTLYNKCWYFIYQFNIFSSILIKKGKNYILHERYESLFLDKKQKDGSNIDIVTKQAN